MSIRLEQLPVEQLQPGKFQPRKQFKCEPLNELAYSIQSQGIIEPLIVRQLTNTTYEILAGERRWRAAQLIALDTVPCLVGQYSDNQALAVSLIENIQRQNLNAIEEALGFSKLIESFHFHQHEVATLLGKSRSYVANSLRLLSLIEEVQDQLINDEITSGHARVLVGLQPDLQKKIAKQIIELNWSVRKTEQVIKALKSSPLKSSEISLEVDKDTQRLQSHLSEQLGAPVEFILKKNNQGGWLKIQYFDNDTLSGLLERIGLTVQE